MDQAHSNESVSENRNDRSSSSSMLQTELSLPIVQFGKLPELNESNFSKAVDYLSQVAKIIENQGMRQHGGPVLSARSIISSIDHMCDIINIALVAIGQKNQKFEHPGEQTDLEKALAIALDEWDRFTEKAKNQCFGAKITP